MRAFDDKENAISKLVPFEEKGMKELLDLPDADHVKVTKVAPTALKKGDVLNVGNSQFEITKAYSGGRFMIKRKP
jgi:hypothetical protein